MWLLCKCWFEKTQKRNSYLGHKGLFIYIVAVFFVYFTAEMQYTPSLIIGSNLHAFPHAHGQLPLLRTCMYSFLSISFYFSLVQKNLPNHLMAEIRISLWDLVKVNRAQNMIVLSSCKKKWFKCKQQIVNWKCLFSPSCLVKYYLKTECVRDEDYTKHIDEDVNFIAKLPNDMTIICDNNEEIQTNKNLVSVLSPTLRPLLSTTCWNYPVLFLPDC